MIAAAAVLGFLGTRLATGGWEKWKRHSSTIKEIIHIEFLNKAPFVDNSLRRIDSTNRRWNTYFYRVRLVSTSNEKTVQVRYLKLTDLEELQGTEFKPWKNTEDLILEWDKEKPNDIPPGGDVLAQFARVFPPELQKITDINLTGSLDIPQLVFTVPLGGWPMKMRFLT